LLVPVPKQQRTIDELPLDNAARLVVFDAVAGVIGGLDQEALHDRIIGRLRVLVPRELHVQGEREYMQSKIAVCLDSGILQPHATNPDFFVRGPETPIIRYPDGSIRSYTAGLEAARERLESVDTKLRSVNFDVLRHVRSIADNRRSPAYRNLVESMMEHGFLDQFRIICSASKEVVDGRARRAAATDAGIKLKPHNIVKLARRRDTPLCQALLVLDVNAQRLSEEDRIRVQTVIAERTGRDWRAIEDDLALTRDWRRAEPKDYDAKLTVECLPFRVDGEAKVQVTTDRTRVMLRSLMQEAGLASYNYTLLEPYVSTEHARTQFSGRRAIFVKIADAIGGIEQMQRDRRRDNKKTDSGWDLMRQWLVATFEAKELGDDTEGSGATVGGQSQLDLSLSGSEPS
jgi:hypothetical protein